MAKKKPKKSDEQLPTDPVDAEDAPQPDSPDPNAPAPNASQPKGFGSDLDETVRIETVEMNDMPPVDPNRQTVAEDRIEQTIPVNPSEPSISQKITVRRGGSSRKTKKMFDKTVVDPQQETTVEINEGSVDQTLPGEHSFLTNLKIDQTVNPRELSDADVTIWNSAVGENNQSTETESTEIEESYAERQLERLRHVNIAALKSSSDTMFDYRLVRKLGQGGMGDVFVARQGSLDRLLALKLIKPLSDQKRDQLEKTGRLNSVEEERRQQFLSEAIITGDLDHPNIVPIHDVGLTSDNQLFYAMKRVVGTPWSDVIDKRSRDENLEILLKASDAIGFAHTRGVVHRDIKPENIMLGDFGVVMVMDWGLALLTSEYEKQESITATSGLGGTPAFMAPEMATGPVKNIGTASDIYLLGATLFMVITGKPPHFAKNITQCLQAVRSNTIREVPPEQQGELMDIALRAMATDPKDRYANVADFQSAIREYRSHAESISLASGAAEDLESGKHSGSYADLARARFRFEESLKSWDGNQKARLGLAETRIVHAEAAYKSGDYDLGLSLLDDQTREHQPIIQKLRDAIRERDSRTTRLALLRKVAAAMLAFIIIGGGVAMYSINKQKQLAQAAAEQEAKERTKAEAARALADSARFEAEKAKDNAEDQKVFAQVSAENAKLEKQNADKQAMIARQQERVADAQREKAQIAERLAEQKRREAVQSQAEAVASQQRAIYEEYVSKIGLAKARLDRNEVDGAREILSELKSVDPSVTDSWEWRWLWRQTNQSLSTLETDSAVIDICINGRYGIVALGNGQVKRFVIDDRGMISRTIPVTFDDSFTSPPTAVAIGADDKQFAIGNRRGQILLITDANQRLLNGHQGRVSDLQYADDGSLLSGSHDRTVRVWDSQDGRELTNKKACWHISPVRQIATTRVGGSLKLAVAIADDATGRVELWDLSRRGDAIVVSSAGTFDQHRQRVTTVAISPDAKRIASGDVAGNVLVWDPSEIDETDYAGSLREAIAAIDDASHNNPRKTRKKQAIKTERLVDQMDRFQGRLVSTTSSADGDETAHDDVIRSLQFNDAGTALLTASDDNTLKIWSVNQPELKTILKGHGGWVVGADFVSGADDIVISASNDTTVRSWDQKTYTGSFVIGRIAKSNAPTRQTDAHRDELTSAALSPDGTHMVTASRDHTARVLRIDPRTLAFTEVARLEDELLQEGSEFVAMSMQLDRKHRRLYVGSADSTIRIWDLDRGVEIGQANKTGLNSSFAVSADGTLMLTGSSLPGVKAMLWKLDPTGTASPKVLHHMKGHQVAVTALAISPNSKQCFTGDRDGRGILWDTKTGQALGPSIDQLRGFRINAAEFTRSGNELLLGSDDEQLTRIDVQSRSIVAQMNHDGVVTQLSVSVDGRSVLTVSELTTLTGLSTTATLWDIHSGQKAVLDQANDPKRNNGKRITSARFDTTGKVASISRSATSTSPATIQLWDLDTSGESLNNLVSSEKRHLSFSTTARIVNSRIERQGNGNRSKRTFRVPTVLGTAQVALPIDDQSMMTMNKNGVFRWSVNDRKLVKSYRPHAALTEASFSFDGKRIVTASRSVKVWDPSTGNAVGKVETPHAGPVRTVRFAPVAIGDTQYVFATGGDDRLVRCWTWNDKTNEAKQIREYELDHQVRRVRFSPDGKQLLIVGVNGLAVLQSLEKGGRAIKLQVPETSDLAGCGFSSDGSVIAVCGSDSNVRLWSIPEPNQEPTEPVVLSGHADVVNDIKLIGASARDLRVLTASADDTARVWDPRLESATRKGRELLSLRQHTTDVMAIDATNDGQLLMTAGRDGSVILWPAGE